MGLHPSAPYSRALWTAFSLCIPYSALQCGFISVIIIYQSKVYYNMHAVFNSLQSELWWSRLCSLETAVLSAFGIRCCHFSELWTSAPCSRLTEWHSWLGLCVIRHTCTNVRLRELIAWHNPLGVRLTIASDIYDLRYISELLKFRNVYFELIKVLQECYRSYIILLFTQVKEADMCVCLP